MRYYRIEPLDTLFFRDGSPFNAGETGQMEVRGVFPPSPTTVAGSLRAAFARELGWEEGAWSEAITSRLGDGDKLEPLRFRGPYLARDREPLFPAPLHLLRASGTKPPSRLKPGDDELQTDIGMTRLPVVETGGFKPLEGAYLTPGAMRDVLNGGVPDSSGIIPAECLWASEARLGIQRDRETRTTKEDSLYQTVHVRLRKGVALVMGVDGYGDHVSGLTTMGGESRMVEISYHERFALPQEPDFDAGDGTLRYTATLITPARLPDEGWREPRGALWGLPGSVVSACIGKPVMIGGWDSMNTRPKPLEPYVPAGSTWFMGGARKDEKEKVLEYHGSHIGEKTEWGYGQILIGAWR